MVSKDGMTWLLICQCGAQGQTMRWASVLSKSDAVGRKGDPQLSFERQLDAAAVTLQMLCFSSKSQLFCARHTTVSVALSVVKMHGAPPVRQLAP